MDGSPVIDTSFDFRIDSAGKDPDKCSPTLRRYHRMLWSKPLPGGEVFALEDGFAGRAVPTDIAGYRQFRAATIDFLHARNQRIEAWSQQHLR